MLDFLKRKPKEAPKLFFHTDMHCHVVPGIDDGSESVAESVELITRMKSWGIDRILATPHVTQETFENTPDTIAQPLADLRAGLQAAGIDIDLDHSAEYRMDENFIKEWKAGRLVPYPNGYLLVESSFIQEPLNMRKLLFDLKVAGFKPIWAHPERYTYYYEKGKRGIYKEIRESGTYLQVNILSLAGYYGKEQKKVAEEMIADGLVNFLGTDLHSHRHADAIEAYLRSKDYRRHADALAPVLLNDRAFN